MQLASLAPLASAMHASTTFTPVTRTTIFFLAMDANSDVDNILEEDDGDLNDS